MNRWLSILVLLLLLVLTGGWLTWYFAYGISTAPPGRAVLEGLGGPVEIGWSDEGFATIEAQSETDAFAGLGYSQTMQRAWMMLLLRQAALGRQAEWFGGQSVDVDRLARRLEFATLAETAYDSLSTESKTLLEAYTRGVNAALRSRAVVMSDELTLLRVEPEPWEPWHTLAVERLFAWIAAPPMAADSLSQAGQDAQAFFEADALLRDGLHLHGFQHSIAWAVRDSADTYFYQRHVYGDNALPFYFEAVMTWPGTTLTGGSIPGTPFFPSGTTQDRAWALLPAGQFQVEQVVDDTTGIPRYERLLSKGGAEELVTLRRSGPLLYFDAPEGVAGRRPDSLVYGSAVPPGGAPSTLADSLFAVRQRVIADSLARLPDSTWALRWSGFGAGSDWDAWHTLATGGTPAFRLIEAGGLAVQPDGSWEVLGTAATVAPLTGGIVVGHTDWTPYLAQALDSLSAMNESVDPGSWSLSYGSVWAEQLAPPLIASIDSIPNKAPLVNEALTYLRNWDFGYDRASIAASIFDSWVALYRDSTGTLPSEQVPDSVYFEDLLRYQMLNMAVERLRAEHGDDLSQWRWETVHPDDRAFPMFSADSLAEDDEGSGRHFGNVEMPGSGHPTTLAWGSSAMTDERFHPSAWEAWTSTASWSEMRVRRRIFDFSTFLSRYRVSERTPAPVVLSPSAEPDQSTLLTSAPS